MAKVDGTLGPEWKREASSGTLRENRTIGKRCLNNMI